MSFTDAEGASPLEDVLGHAYAKHEYDRSSIDVHGKGWTRPTTKTSHFEEVCINPFSACPQRVSYIYVAVYAFVFLCDLSNKSWSRILDLQKCPR